MDSYRARKLIEAELERRRLPFTTVEARVAAPGDFALEKGVLVTIYGWRPSVQAEMLRLFARENGFRVEFRGQPARVMSE